jgi:predicted phosphodiesterase
MFILTISQAKQVLVRESKFVRKAVIKKLDELINSEESIIKNLIFDIYKGGQVAIESSRKLTEIEVEKATTPLKIDIEHKTKVIDNITQDLDGTVLRVIVTDYVNKIKTETGRNHAEIYSEIYKLVGRSLKKDLKKVQSKIDWIKSLRIPYVASNHEGEQNLPFFYIDEETRSMFTHGCHLKKNAEKYLKDCRTKWEGSNYLTHVITGLASKMIHMVPFTKDDAKRASDFAKMYGCKNIILGHWHLSYDENVNGVRVVVCPRGITEVEL